MNVPGIPWSPGEAASVNEFLNSPLGRKWLGVLLLRKPRTVIDKGRSTAALTGAYAAGYEAFFSEIAATRTAQAEEQPARPPIDMTKD